MSRFGKKPSRKERREKRFPVVVRLPTAKDRSERRDFKEIDAFFVQLESGYVDEAGGLIVRTNDAKEQYSVLHALEGWLLFWRTLAIHISAEYDDQALVGLLAKLNHDMPLTINQVEAAKAVVERQRTMYRETPANVISSISQVVAKVLAEQDERAAA